MSKHGMRNTSDDDDDVRLDYDGDMVFAVAGYRF